MPNTLLTEDAIKDVTEALLEELKLALTDEDYEKIFEPLQKASYDVWEEYNKYDRALGRHIPKPYRKIRMLDPHTKVLQLRVLQPNEWPPEVQEEDRQLTWENVEIVKPL